MFKLKNLTLLVASLGLTLGFAQAAQAQKGGGRGGGAVHVNGYYRSNGTYVQPHYRSAPDGNFYNNWSTKGNVNPFTGEPGTKTVNPNKGSYGVGSFPYAGPSAGGN